ncbi:Ig-like domain-containing protein [Blastopirellula marina]|uniref:Carboxypeptidase regulatory-like domain-containing protein n=1 Tax=Blastopirellula marina TaxID=124 RepID=A0A2S8F6Y9_9BACT|nr:Ig-like domain-containing protein [Blastopirellula marina]PQO27900.1 carboxypeptidase regulatory-like domain-containing protein [Blastopirellula marina]PTL41636.1 carboxypeptidase regulatory-like domain-containing protein [Blastopirellula marina]
MRSYNPWSSGGICLVLLACQGCFGGSSVPLANVDGVVTKDGNPVVAATVVFNPTTGRPSSGKTDEKGVFHLQFTQDHQGAVLGQHTVIISLPGSGAPSGPVGSGKRPPRPKGSGIEEVHWPEPVTVEKSGNAFTFDL